MNTREHSLIILSFFVAMLSVSAQTANQTKKAESDLLNMVKTYAMNDPAGTRKQLLSKVEATPNDDAAWYYLGLCNLNLGKNAEAVENFKKAASLDTANYWYSDRLAIAYEAAGQDELTIDTYEKLLNRFPKKTEIYFNLVNLYLRHGQYDKALEEMDNIDGVMGPSEQIAGMRYQILLHQKKPEEAFGTLEKFNKDYSSPNILTTMGDYKMAQYEDSLALAYYEEALGLSSDFIPAILGKAEVFRQRREYPLFFKTVGGFLSNREQAPSAKARYIGALIHQGDPSFVRNFMPQIDSLIDECLALHPSDSTMLQTAGSFYFDTGRWDMASDAFRKNMLLYPKSKIARITYIQFLGINKDWTGVIAAADSASLDFEGDLDFEEMKIAAYYNMDDWKSIIATEEKIISMAGNDTSRTIPAWSSIGDAWFKLSDPKKAYKAFDQVLKISPFHAPTLNNYAYYLSLEEKKLKKAAAMSKRTVESEPDNPTYLDTYAWILHLQGKSQEAKTYFKHAMLYGGKESIVILDHYAEVLFALGEYDLARVYWSQAKARNKNGEIPDLDARIKAHEAMLKSREAKPKK